MCMRIFGRLALLLLMPAPLIGQPASLPPSTARAGGPIDTRGSSLPAMTADAPTPSGTALPTPATPPVAAFAPVVAPVSPRPAAAPKTPSRKSGWPWGLLGLAGLAGLLRLRRSGH
jgi:hypothetical protein